MNKVNCVRFAKNRRYREDVAEECIYGIASLYFAAFVFIAVLIVIC